MNAETLEKELLFGVKSQPLRGSNALLLSVENNLRIALTMVLRAQKENGKSRTSTMWIAEGDLLDAAHACKEWFKKYSVKL